MVNYKDAKIYKIVCNITGKVYYGSTCTTLCRRLTGHRTAFDRYNKGLDRSRITSIDVLTGGDYNIILVPL